MKQLLLQAFNLIRQNPFYATIFSKYSLYRPYLLTISYSEIVEGKLVPLAPIVMLMALFDANSLLFLLILCLLYYFPEFFVELASTEIFCAQETDRKSVV